MAVRIDNWKLIVGNPVGSLFEQLYIYKRSFCQDRLGTNIRKVEKKRAQRHSPICVSVIIDTHIHTHCCARSNEISIEFGQRGLVLLDSLATRIIGFYQPSLVTNPPRHTGRLLNPIISRLPQPGISSATPGIPLARQRSDARRMPRQRRPGPTTPTSPTSPTSSSPTSRLATVLSTTSAARRGVCFI